MKKTELKKILKPLVKQSVREALLEEGLLSNIISEVVTGLSPSLVKNKSIHLQKENTQKQQQLLEQQRQELEEEKMRTAKEQKRKLLNATGFGSEIFEGVNPLTSGGSINAPPNTGALSDMDPGDAGVDISGIVNLSGKKWSKLV